MVPFSARYPIWRDNDLPSMSQPHLERQKRTFEGSVLMTSTGHRRQPEEDRIPWWPSCQHYFSLHWMHSNLKWPDVSLHLTLQSCKVLTRYCRTLSSISFLKCFAFRPSVELYVDSMDMDVHLPFWNGNSQTNSFDREHKEAGTSDHNLYVNLYAENDVNCMVWCWL